MNIIDNREVTALASQLRHNAAKGAYRVSDLLLQQDGKTLQFVDLVMEGGGTLGIALVGYIYAMEQAGIRFLSVGGSSVGAIVSLLLACCADRIEKKGAILAEVVSNMDMGAFVDGNCFAAALSRLLGSDNAGKRKIFLTILALLASPSVFKKLGLNPGDQFLEWLRDSLAAFDIHTLKDAQRLVAKLPEGLQHRTKGGAFTPPEPALKMVVADLTTNSKVVFPDMAPLYWQDPEEINPALFARASMSIPFFFQPMEVTGVSDIVARNEKWHYLCSFQGDVPDRITFADGGLVSNFPISLFHKNRLPNAPTFGARLGSACRVVKEIHSLGGYSGNLFSALRHYSDYDFIYQNPDYRCLITFIPTLGHNWLNFNMTPGEKTDLFLRGMTAAYDFLETFDWEAYKQVRQKQLALET